MTNSDAEIDCVEFDSQEHEKCFVKVRKDYLDGSSPNQILDRWCGLSWTDELILHCIEDVKAELSHVISWPDPKTLDGREQKWIWYTGPNDQSVRWNHYLQSLREKGHIGEETLTELEKSTTRILNLCPPPARSSFQSRGLVMGHVQSGKTTNFLGLVAKAADENYRLIIILSGITNNLRDQTQSRLNGMVKGNENNWHLLTQDTIDFRANIGNAQQLCSNVGTTLVAVVKKNKSRLNALHSWLSKVSPLTRMTLPVLIIDDESDQATTNAGTEEKRAAINLALSNLMDKNFLPKVAYVGYTATPFANILADTSDLNSTYPRDFIVSLTKSTGYFGAHELFGTESLENEEEASGADIIRDISNADTALVAPPRSKAAVAAWAPVIPESLATSIYWFILATATSRARGQVGSWNTMMVHTTSNIEPQFKTAAAIDEFLNRLSDKETSEVLSLVKSVWDDEISRAADLQDGVRSVWQEVLPHIPEVLIDIKVFVDNSKSPHRLNYVDDDVPRFPVILVGGNTLSRGLTLEGLVSSYFLRTSNAYDSLMQMGRWFGYRPGYADLQRIWMSNESPYETKYWFRELAQVEQEIRDQIEIYASDGLTPMQLGIRIRSLPGMAITARAKNHGELVHIGYGKTRQQTILFDSDRTMQKENLALVSKVVEEIDSESTWEKTEQGWWLTKNVSVSHLINFIDNYHVHENIRTLQKNHLLNYISKLNEEGELLSWNVVLYSNSKPSAPEYDVTPSIKVRMANRSRMNEPTLNIKALISLKDMIADKPSAANGAVDENGKSTEAALWNARRLDPELSGTGLLGIYIIDKHSEPATRNAVRVKLGTEEHLVGYYLIFPETSSKQNVDYQAPNLAQVAIDIEEDLDDPYEDEAAEETDALALPADLA